MKSTLIVCLDSKYFALKLCLQQKAQDLKLDEFDKLRIEQVDDSYKILVQILPLDFPHIPPLFFTTILLIPLLFTFKDRRIWWGLTGQMSIIQFYLQCLLLSAIA